MSERAREYEQYLKSQEWAAMRRWALERAENRCQVCNSEKRLDVHHRTYERLGHEWPSDLTVLCRDCHELYHGRMADAPEVERGSERPRHSDPEVSRLEERLDDLQRRIKEAVGDERKLELIAEKAEVAAKLRERFPNYWRPSRRLSSTGTEG